MNGNLRLPTLWAIKQSGGTVPQPNISLAHNFTLDISKCSLSFYIFYVSYAFLQGEQLFRGMNRHLKATFVQLNHFSMGIIRKNELILSLLLLLF